MNQEYKNKALVDVARHNHARAAEVLLRHGAQIDWQDKLEQTALFEAVERGHQSVAVVLLRRNVLGEGHLTIKFPPPKKRVRGFGY